MNNNINGLGIIVLSIALEKMLDEYKLESFGFLEEGFYIDFSTSGTLSANDFPKIEKNISKVTSGAYKIENIDDNIKCEKQLFINLDLNKYTNTNQLKYIVLNSLGGIELDNSKNNYRINSCCFENENDKREYLIRQEDLRNRDHRKIGNELEIFTFDDMIGPGLPIFLPNGAYIKEKISNYLKEVFFNHGFQMVSTPVLGSKKLYVTSGHWDLYKENNFPPINIDGEEYMLRPMTCPHHMLVFKSSNRSYKDLPFQIFEEAKLHRYESSGGLIGLERVRAMELFDTHIFVSREQIKFIVKKLNKMINEVYEKLGVKIDRVDLSLRSKDKSKFFDDDKMWDESQSMLKEILNELGYEYTEFEGEAAFYGPKIDFQYKTVLGKYITISTIQLDFLLPKRFELSYKNSNGEMETPVLIHFGIIGTYERFISALLSQTKGNLPFWLQKTQVEIIPINNEFHLEYSKKIYNELINAGFNVKLNDTNERMSKKIMNSQKGKVRYQLIIGDSEKENNNISYRKYGEDSSKTTTINDFVEILKKEK